MHTSALRSRLSSIRRNQACVCAQMNHLWQLGCSQASDDARECMKIALFKASGDTQACVCAQMNHLWQLGCSQASDDALECMKIALFKNQAIPKHAYAHKSCIHAQGSAWAAPRTPDDAPECMKVRLSSIMRNPSVPTRTNYESALA